MTYNAAVVNLAPISTMATLRTFLLICAALCVVRCGTQPDYPKADDPLDAGRRFIDACLKGDFDRAAFYMAADEKNNSLLLEQKRNYEAKGKQEQREYNEASIIINEDAVVNDTTHVINYQNSYDNTGRKVKVVLRNGTWVVDFKYTFDGNL